MSIKTTYWIERQKEWASEKRSTLLKTSDLVTSRDSISLLNMFQYINNIDNIDNKILCEFGCGTGRYLGCINKYKYLYGIEFMKDNVNIANKIKPENCEILLEDIINLKFKEKIDIAYTITCLQHIHPTQIIKAIKNIMDLNPEEIIIQEVNNTTYKNKDEDEETNYIWGHNYIDIICSDLKIYNYTHISDEVLDNNITCISIFKKNA